MCVCVCARVGVEGEQGDRGELCCGLLVLFCINETIPYQENLMTEEDMVSKTEKQPDPSPQIKSFQNTNRSLSSQKQNKNAQYILIP